MHCTCVLRSFMIRKRHRQLLSAGPRVNAFRTNYILTHATVRAFFVLRFYLGAWYRLVCLLHVNRNECAKRGSCPAVTRHSAIRRFSTRPDGVSSTRDARTAETFRNGPVGKSVLLPGEGGGTGKTRPGLKENSCIYAADYGRGQRATRAPLNVSADRRAVPERTAY